MRILVYLDTPRQRSYVASVEAAVAGIEGVHVFSGGPGVAEDYFELAGVSYGTPVLKVPPVAFTTRVRRGLRDLRVRWHLAYHAFLKATQPSRRRLQASVEAGRAPIRSLPRPREERPALRATIGALQGIAEAVRAIGRSARAFVAGMPRAVRSTWLARRPNRRDIRKLHPLLRPAALFLYRAALLATAVATIGLNSVGIMRQLFLRRLYLHEATKLIERVRPQVIVVMEDNAEGLTGVMTFAARRAGIPFIVLPDYIPNPIEPATFYRDSRAHQVRTLLDRLVATAYPKWTYVHNGRTMLRLPAATIMAYHLLRCDPPAPWILNSGYANAIALDSPAIWAHYRDLGFRQSKLRVIGTAQDDRLHARFSQRADLRATLMRDLDLPADRPIALCAFPPDQYASSAIGAFEYPSYDDLVRAWFAELVAISGNMNVIVRPHPRTAPGLLEQTCPPGIRIVWTPTEDLIPICDLYVASVSTTIRWALSLGIPVLNYDCYRYGYGDFSAARGVLECTDRSVFARNLQVLTGGNDELAANARSDREAWGQVDGKYASRLRHLLEDVASDTSEPQPTHTAPAGPGAAPIRAALAQLWSQR